MAGAEGIEPPSWRVWNPLQSQRLLHAYMKMVRMAGLEPASEISKTSFLAIELHARKRPSIDELLDGFILLPLYVAQPAELIRVFQGYRLEGMLDKWWGRMDLNHQHVDFQTTALHWSYYPVS